MRYEVRGLESEIRIENDWIKFEIRYVIKIFFLFAYDQNLFDLDVYRIGNEYAMKIFFLTRSFPKSEAYSLTSQIVNSSRSICANIAEGWGRRTYEGEFKKFLVYSMGSLQETKSWLQFALQCEYIAIEVHDKLMEDSEIIGSKLYNLHKNWKS